MLLLEIVQVFWVSDVLYSKYTVWELQIFHKLDMLNC
jgi:hypothetical protein